jgi:hypothetical protein
VARMIVRQVYISHGVAEIVRGDDGQEYLVQRQFSPEVGRLLDAVLMVRRATLWRDDGAGSEAFPPRRGYIDQEAFLLYFLELVVDGLDNHPVMRFVAKPEDAAMLRRVLHEFSELLDASCEGGGGCAAARRTVACSQGNVGARAARHRANWTPRSCAQCGARETEPKLYKLCSRCGAVAYCCKEHQVQHWRAGHKAACRKDA